MSWPKALQASPARPSCAVRPVSVSCREERVYPCEDGAALAGTVYTAGPDKNAGVTPSSTQLPLAFYQTTIMGYAIVSLTWTGGNVVGKTWVLEHALTEQRS